MLIILKSHVFFQKIFINFINKFKKKSKVSKKLPMKSAVFEHFTITEDGKHFVCHCMIHDLDEGKYCDTKIGAYSGSDKNFPI